jgi:hypothetical protein
VTVYARVFSSTEGEVGSSRLLAGRPLVAVVVGFRAEAAAFLDEIVPFAFALLRRLGVSR